MATKNAINDEVIAERKGHRDRYRPGVLREYVVTITQEHFVTVKAPNPEVAGTRAIRKLSDQWGSGRNPVVTEVEIA